MRERRTDPRRHYDPDRVARWPVWELALAAAHLTDAATLARKDLRLELRARDHAARDADLRRSRFSWSSHLALQSGSSKLAELGLLWVAILFTALLGLGRAFVAEREQGLLDGLVLAPVDQARSGWRSRSRRLAFLVVAEAVALPALRALLRAGGLVDGRGRRCSRTSASARSGSLLAAMSAAGQRAEAAVAAALPRRWRCRS